MHVDVTTNRQETTQSGADAFTANSFGYQQIAAE
jgi:hypothetical protein